MHAQLNDLLTATYVLVDDFLPKRRGPGRPPRITDAELITLAIAQVFMGLPNDRQFLALAGYRLSHLFAYATSVGLQQASARAHPTDRASDQLPRLLLAGVRQWIESVFWTCKGQLGLERHGARTLPGLCARVGLRLLALAAGLRHNAEIGQPRRCFSAYGH